MYRRGGSLEIFVGFVSGFVNGLGFSVVVGFGVVVSFSVVVRTVGLDVVVRWT